MDKIAKVTSEENAALLYTNQLHQLTTSQLPHPTELLRFWLFLATDVRENRPMGGFARM